MNKTGISQKIFHVVVAVLCLCLYAATLTGAYGGYVDPCRWLLPALMCMAFPWLFVMTVFAAVVSLLWDRRLALAGVVTAVLCLGPALNICPLHLSDVPTGYSPASADTFSVMTYNTYYFNSYQSMALDGAAADETALAILNADASVVMMQEAVPFDPFEMGRSKVSAPVAAAVRSRYPYRYFGATSMAIMSKFPFRRVPVTYDNMGESSFLLERYDVQVGDSTVLFYNVHLQSLMISKQDLGVALRFKALFTSARAVTSARDILFPKLTSAFRKRALQARIVRRLVDESGDAPVVLCGDFNDVPGCYAVRMVKGDNLRDCYAEAAFGPAVTFRSNHLYFRIDQMLCSRSIEPLSTRRIAAGGSDHYPLVTVFAFD